MDAAAAVRETAATTIRATISSEGFTVQLDTNSIVVGAAAAVGVGVGLGVVLLADVYYRNGENTKQMRDAFVRAFRGEGDDRNVGNIGRGSLIFDLHCHTAESFLQFLEDYKSGQVERDLKEELLKIEIEVKELSIKIKNKKEVEEHKEKLRSAGIEWTTIEGKVQIINKSQ